VTKTNTEKSSSYAGHCSIFVSLIYCKDLRSRCTFYQKFDAKCTSAKTCNACAYQC